MYKHVDASQPLQNSDDFLNSHITARTERNNLEDATETVRQKPALNALMYLYDQYIEKIFPPEINVPDSVRVRFLFWLATHSHIHRSKDQQFVLFAATLWQTVQSAACASRAFPNVATWARKMFQIQEFNRTLPGVAPAEWAKLEEREEKEIIDGVAQPPWRRNLREVVFVDEVRIQCFRFQLRFEVPEEHTSVRSQIKRAIATVRKEKRLLGVVEKRRRACFAYYSTLNCSIGNKDLCTVGMSKNFRTTFVEILTEWFTHERTRFQKILARAICDVVFQFSLRKNQSDPYCRNLNPARRAVASIFGESCSETPIIRCQRLCVKWLDSVKGIETSRHNVSRACYRTRHDLEEEEEGVERFKDDSCSEQASSRHSKVETVSYTPSKFNRLKSERRDPQCQPTIQDACSKRRRVA